MTSVAERKRKRRGRKRLEGITRENNGRPSRAKLVKLEPIPEQVAKREAWGLLKGDELDCAIARAFRAGIIDASMRQEADRLRALHAAMSAAIQSPGRPGDTLGAYQPGRGGPMTDEAARLACDAWDRAKFAIAVRGGPEAQRAVRALIVDGVVSPDRDSLRAGLTTRRD